MTLLRKIKIIDEDDNEIAIINGGYGKLRVIDHNSQELLEGILSVLKKIEYHLSIATDTNFENEDL